MKKTVRKVLAFIIALTVLFGGISFNSNIAIASGNNSALARDKIQIYSQWNYDAYGSYLNRWICGSGCGLLTIGHALQWLGVIGRDTESSNATICGLFVESGYEGTVLWSERDNTLKFLAGKYPNFSFEYNTDLRSIINNGGVALINKYGHQYLAVDISSDSNYVHIVDSCLIVPAQNNVEVFAYNSSTGSFVQTSVANCAVRNDIRWYCSDVYTNSMVQANNSNPLYAGGEYWVKYSEVSNYAQIGFYGPGCKTLDVNVYQNGIMHDTGVDCCTFDVTINGSRVANDVKDFCQENIVSGSTYKVDDIKINGCYKNNGKTSYTGTITADMEVNLEVVTYHPSKTVSGKAATCTEPGLSSGTVCSKCGKVLTAQTTIPAMGHRYNSERISGSCTEPAKIKYTCTVCGATKYEYIGDGTYGEWTATEPSVSGSTVIETKTQYKSREKSYKSSTSSSLTGYTLRTDKEPTYGEWGNWSGWKTGSLSGNDTREVENKVLYRYYAFVCNCGQRDPYSGPCSSCGTNLTEGNGVTVWSPIAYKDSNSSYFNSAKRSTTSIDGSVWFFNAGDLNNTTPGTYSEEASDYIILNGYRYHERSKTYYFEKWSAWSDWSDTEVKASDTVEVQTRTMYRTFTPAAGGSHTWNSGVVTTPATCTSEGVKTFTCTVCTATKTETIAKLNHNYTNKADAKYLKFAATETSAAVYYVSCSVCGAKGTETFASGSPLPPAVVTDTVLGVTSAKTMAGKEIALTLSFEKNPGVAGLSVSLNYDTSVLTLKSATNGTLFSSLTSGKNFIFDNTSNVTSDGTVATFTFTVNDNADAGDYTVTPVVRSCVNDGGEDVAVKTEKGTVTVIDFIYGDANDDEMIDMKDVVLLRRYLAEFDYETNSSPVEIGLGADANGDDEIDMKDVVLLRRYLAEYDYETDTSSVVLGPQ